ncbi:MAG: hypothetical protein VKP72_05320 [bacterium]|nr:hypothetical protein [bacterium]
MNITSKLLDNPVGRMITRKPPSKPAGSPQTGCKNPSLAKGTLSTLKLDTLPPRLQSFQKEFDRVQKSEQNGPLSAASNFLRSPMAPRLGWYKDELQKFASQSPTKTGMPEMPPRIDKSYFAESVRPQVKKLGDWILGQPSGSSLTPADVYKKSLELNKNNTFEARLTAHNLMKDVTASSRGAVSSTAEIRARDQQIESRLINLRESSDKNPDKMGPWYRFFGAGLADSVMQGGVVDKVDMCGDFGEDVITKASLKMWAK